MGTYRPGTCSEYMLNSNRERAEKDDEDRRRRCRLVREKGLMGVVTGGVKEIVCSTGDGVPAKGKKAPFLSPRPERGVGTRLGSCNEVCLLGMRMGWDFESGDETAVLSWNGGDSAHEVGSRRRLALASRWPCSSAEARLGTVTVVPRETDKSG